MVGESFDGPVHSESACKRNDGERLLYIQNMEAKAAKPLIKKPDPS